MLCFSNVTKLQGARALYQDASFQADPGDRIGIVGPNGVGKSTLFRMIVGEEGLDGGEITFPSKAKIGYFSQEVGEMSGGTPVGEVLRALGFEDKINKLRTLEERLSEEMDPDEMTRVLEEYGEAQTDFESAGGYELEVTVQTVLTGLGIGPEDQELPLESFSGGWKMRIEMAKTLALEPDILLMDEPTNHLDLESIVWLGDWLERYKGVLLITSHDREFLNQIATSTVEVTPMGIQLYGGNYDFYERERELRAEQLVAAFKRQEKMLVKEKEFIARFKARASHAAQVQSRVKKLEKIERVELPENQRRVKFEFQKPPRSGQDVVKFEDVSKSYERPDGRVLEVFNGLNGMVRRLDKVAVVGVNGAGKSTLLKMVADGLEPTAGTVSLGASLELGYFSQSSLDLLDPKLTVFEQVLQALPQLTDSQVRSLLGCFLFSGDDADKKISVLSGGERSRVVLAMILGRPVNFLVLDEPTNHLDMTSREILLEALKDFEGTVLLVSHDRFFLKALSNRTFHVNEGKVQVFEGGYSEFVNSEQGNKRAR